MAVVVAAAIDVAIVAFTAGQAIYGTYAIKKFIKANKHYMLRAVAPELIKMFGSVAGHALAGALEVVMIVAGTSFGGIIANAIDYNDGNRNNGYVFG